MDILTNIMLQIHCELLRQDDGVYPSHNRSAVAKPPLLARTLTAMGEAMIHLGGQLKEHSSQSYADEKAAEPTYMIML